MNGTPKICALCGATFYGDRRHKYCSEECAEEAHRKKARERFRVRYYVTHREEELERQRKRYRDNPEAGKVRSAQWSKQNKERCRELSRRWYQKKKEAASND